MMGDGAKTEFTMSKVAWVVDDHNLVNAGLCALLYSLKRFDEVLSFASPANLPCEPQSIPPRLILADFFIPNFPLEDWLPQLRLEFPESLILVVSSSISKTDQAVSLKLGANAYIEKHTKAETFIDFLQTQLQKTTDSRRERPVDTIQYDYFLSNSQHDGLIDLTPSQSEVFVQLSRGLSTKAIASQLNVSPETVKSHLKHVYKKMGARNRQHAIDIARHKGLI